MMTRPKFDIEAEGFLDYEIIGFTIQASITRGDHVYKQKSSVSETEKKEFKQSLKKVLKKYGVRYRKEYINSDQHGKNIEKLASAISAKHCKILKGGRFKIGRAQKLLNLYLKYQWVLDKMKNWKTSKPPHCPFDYQMIKCLIGSGETVISWTKMDSLDVYMEWVSKAEIAASEHNIESIAEWELWYYNNTRYGVSP